MGTIGQLMNIGSLNILEDRYEFVNPAPINIDVNYSCGYFDYQNRSDDIFARLTKCITNIPLDLTYK